MWDRGQRHEENSINSLTSLILNGDWSPPIYKRMLWQLQRTIDSKLKETQSQAVVTLLISIIETVTKNEFVFTSFRNVIVNNGYVLGVKNVLNILIG